MYNRPLAGLCVATALFVCAFNGAPVLPAGPPASNGVITIVDVAPGSSLTPGTKIDVVGTGFISTANVSVGMYSTPTALAEVVADTGGVATATVTVPNQPGTHTLVMLGNDPDGGSLVLTAQIKIASSSSGGSGGLPVTGTGAGVLIAVAVLLLVAGTGLLRSTRRREHAPPMT